MGSCAAPSAKGDDKFITTDYLQQCLWKVLNVGDEARRRNMIRGQIVSDGGYCTKKETTDFRGDHVVECYVIKNEVVVARAQIEVPIN